MFYAEYVLLFGYGKLKINEDIKREIGSEMVRQKDRVTWKRTWQKYTATVKINGLLIKMAQDRFKEGTF